MHLIWNNSNLLAGEKQFIPLILAYADTLYVYEASKE